MVLFESAWDVASPVLIWALGLPIAHLIGRSFSQTQKRALFLYVWHTIWCLAYLIFSLNGGSDSVGYYEFSGLRDFSPGTSAVSWITLFLARLLSLSYLSCFLVYNIIGTCGYLALDSILGGLVVEKSLIVKRLAALVILLPSISFWSSAIGKDAFAFTASCLALWSALHLKNRLLFALLSIGLMFLVRPHVAGIMVLAFLVDLLFKRKLPLLPRLAFLVVSIGISFFLVPFAADYSRVSEIASADDLNSFIEKRQGYNQGGSGGLDISQMPLPLQMVAYIFRPAIFDVNSPFALAAAIDNLVLLFIFGFGVWGFLRGRRPPAGSSNVFMIVYSSVSWILFSMTTANLGIAIRQKWMFLPMFLYLAFSVAGRSRSLACPVGSSSASPCSVSAH
jgi:hypothetical protein